MDYIERPEQISRLNSKHEDDNLVEDAFKRLSEKQKIFCCKQMNNSVEDVSNYIFEIRLYEVKYSNAHLMNMKTRN